MAKRYAVVTVRMEPELHERLTHRAMLEGLRRGDPDFSMNRLCLEALKLHLQRLAEAAMDEFDRVGSY